MGNTRSCHDMYLPERGYFTVQVLSADDDQFWPDHVEIETEGSRTFRAYFGDGWVYYSSPQRHATGTEGARCSAYTWQQYGKYGCCSSTYQCGENEGDCDDDSQCKPGLVCGEDNCNSIDSRFASHADCCVKAYTPPPITRILTSRTSMTRLQAKQFCERQGLEMVKISNAEDQMRIVERLN